MNNYNYQPSGVGPQLTPISSLPTRPYQQDSPGPSQTLPPLHTQTNPTNYSGNSYRDSSQNTRSPQSATLPAPSHRTSSLSQIAPQPPYSNQQSHPYTPIAPNFSSGPSSNYGATANASGNVNASSGQFPPMTLPQPPFYDSAHNQTPPYPLNNSQYQSQPGPQSENDKGRIIPVVGSQGRRGILPSANGRVPPLGGTVEGSANARLTPMKGPDGKYSCQYCNKVYLHLKHLKRHHLRHTGERPYQCCLCHETFCRSDILKRHFQKCSLRRGNPTGANHLTHAQAHLGRPANSAAAPATNANGGGSSTATNPPVYRSTWSNGPTQPGQEQAPNAHPSQALESDISSRSSSMMRRGSGSADDRKRYSGANNLASMNNSIDTSPSISGPLSQTGDRKPMPYPNMKHEHQPPTTTGYQAPQSNFYTHQPPASQYHSTTQADQFPSYHYNAPNGYRPYPPNQYENMPHEPLANYFSPGGQDAVMFSNQ